MIALKIALTCVISYLLGSLNFSIICSKLFKKDDVRGHGSGNAGITNYLRNYGGITTLIVMVGDMGKCVAAVLVGQYIFRGDLVAGYDIADAMKFLAGFFVMLGHMFPLYFGFKGGKGVLSTAALILAFDWRMFLIGISIFIIIVLITRYVSLGSVIAVWSVLPLVWVFYRTAPLVWVYMLIYAAIGALVTIRHRSNIVRLMHHNESKFSFGHKNGK